MVLFYRFNSTIVRLKEKCTTEHISTERWFQFYDSAIKRNASANEIFRNEKGFNSTIVRLKGLTILAEFYESLQFQFYDSAIKSYRR